MTARIPFCCSGKAYFISDGAPINNFEFLRPLAEAVGAPFPSLRLPASMALVIARVGEVLHYVTGLEPLLTRAEVYKVFGRAVFHGMTV